MSEAPVKASGHQVRCGEGDGGGGEGGGGGGGEEGGEDGSEDGGDDGGDDGAADSTRRMRRSDGTRLLADGDWVTTVPDVSPEAMGDPQARATSALADA